MNTQVTWVRVYAFNREYTLYLICYQASEVKVMAAYFSSQLFKRESASQRIQITKMALKKQRKRKKSNCFWPWVREVSEARRPSLKLIGERLWVSLCWEVSAAIAGLAGLALKKDVGVTPGGELLGGTTSLRQGGSSSRPRSLCIEPMS